ncbi:hypothetical protein BgiBS90_002481 [Biomphalaria glabrata]|nr:hypothetical protein BgiBS90_002481 [Biomphalaria glabrata]
MPPSTSWLELASYSLALMVRLQVDSRGGTKCILEGGTHLIMLTVSESEPRFDTGDAFFLSEGGDNNESWVGTAVFQTEKKMCRIAQDAHEG